MLWQVPGRLIQLAGTSLSWGRAFAPKIKTTIENDSTHQWKIMPKSTKNAARIQSKIGRHFKAIFTLKCMPWASILEPNGSGQNNAIKDSTKKHRKIMAKWPHYVWSPKSHPWIPFGLIWVLIGRQNRTKWHLRTLMGTLLAPTWRP